MATDFVPEGGEFPLKDLVLPLQALHGGNTPTQVLTRDGRLLALGVRQQEVHEAQMLKDRQLIQKCICVP